MRDEAHMVCVDGSEGGEAVSHNSEQCNEYIVDHIDDVVFSATDVDPACCDEGWYVLICWLR